MASNPLNMKPTELIRLMNRAGFGTVLNESRLKTHRLNDINTADNKGVDLLKYAAWLTLEYFGKDDGDESSEYLERKRKQAERNAEAVRVAQDIGKLPDVADQRRKDESLDSFRRFCETYFGEVFYLPWSDDHLHVISKIERAVTQGGLFAMAMPRGSGKTVLCQTAVVWAALSGATPFVCLIAASAERGKDLLENIKTWLETNELLQQDFPEVCFPIQCLERIANRQKPASTTAQYRFNLKSRTMETFNSSPLYSNIVGTNSTGGLVIGGHLFKAVKQSATGSSYTIRLHYVLNFKTASTAAYKDVVLTTGEGMSVATDTMPVMVYRTDTGNIEIFVAISSGSHDGEMGFNIRKVTVSGLDNPATLTTETTDLGLLPYCVSNFGTTAALYLTGYHDGTHYYLPYTSTIDATGKIDMVAENAFQNGIVISSDFKSVSRVFNMRNSTAGPNLIVRADTGLLQCQANDSKIPYIFMSQVVSRANLPQASVKELDDVLRIIYKYRLI